MHASQTTHTAAFAFMAAVCDSFAAYPAGIVRRPKGDGAPQGYQAKSGKPSIINIVEPRRTAASDNNGEWNLGGHPI